MTEKISGGKLKIEFKDIDELKERSLKSNYYKENVESFENATTRVSLSEYNRHKNNIKKGLIEKEIMKEDDFGKEQYSVPDYMSSYVGTGLNIASIASGNPKIRYRKKLYKKEIEYKIYINIVYPITESTKHISKIVSYIVSAINYLALIGIKIELYGAVCSRFGVFRRDFTDVTIIYPIDAKNSFIGIDNEYAMKYLSGEFFRSHIFNVLKGIKGMNETLGTVGGEDYMLNLKKMKDEKDIIEYIAKDFKLFLA